MEKSKELVGLEFKGVYLQLESIEDECTNILAQKLQQQATPQ